MREKKSAETRAKILEAALELFREKGFAETSMREVANRAKVATGLAYYYFASKDVIVHDFYQKAKSDLAPLLDAAQKGKKLEARLAAIIQVKFKYFEPNRKFLGALMATRPIRRIRCRPSRLNRRRSGNRTWRSSNARWRKPKPLSRPTWRRTCPRSSGCTRWG